MINPYDSIIDQNQLTLKPGLTFYKSQTFPTMHPVHWLTSHFAVGGWSPLQRLSGMLTAHMTSIAPRNGFSWHPHRGLEIYTYVIEGELTHEDTTGGRGVIRAGEVQRMFSGYYIEHQELNRSDKEARVIQIWFAVPIQHMGLNPHYEQISLDDMPTHLNGDGLVSTIIGPGGATNSHVEARLTATILPPNGQTAVELPGPGEDLFLYFVNGRGHIEMAQGPDEVDLYDVLIAGNSAESARISTTDEALTFLSFYLPPFIP